MMRMAIPGWPAQDDAVEVSTLEEAFDEWWRRNVGDLGVDVLLIVDAEVRAATGVCRSVLESAVGMAGVHTFGTARAVVMRTKLLGVEILGAWLREEPLTDHLRARAASLEADLDTYLNAIAPPP